MIIFYHLFSGPRHQGKVSAKIQQLLNTLKVCINYIVYMMYGDWVNDLLNCLPMTTNLTTLLT
jgi:hypothetical protein